MTPDETIYIVEAEMRRSVERLRKIERKAELTEAEKIRIGEVTNFHKHVKRLIEVYQRDRSIAFGRIPPHSLELEKSVLGALMLHSGKSQIESMNAALAKIKSFLRPDHFYTDAHAIIYKAILSMSEPNVQAVHNHLRKEGLSEVVGGPSYVAGLTAGVTNAYQEENARILIEFAIKRKLIMIGANFMDVGYDNTSDALEALEAAEREIEGLNNWVKV